MGGICVDPSGTKGICIKILKFFSVDIYPHVMISSKKSVKENTMQRTRLGIIAALILCASSTVYAAPVPTWGVSVSAPVIDKDPPHLHAYRGSVWYQPQSLVWSHFHIYFDASAAHWWVADTSRHRSLNILALAPIVRYYFTTNSYFSPYLNASIGVSYLSQTKIADQNLGMHFAFQDQLGLGATLGKTQQLSVTLTAMHYSNCSLARWNAGITVPMMVEVDYGFG